MNDKPFIYVVKTTRNQEEEASYSCIVRITTEKDEIDEAITKLKKELHEDWCYDWILDREMKYKDYCKVLVYESTFGEIEFIIEVEKMLLSMNTVKTLAKHI